MKLTKRLDNIETEDNQSRAIKTFKYILLQGLYNNKKLLRKQFLVIKRNNITDVLSLLRFPPKSSNQGFLTLTKDKSKPYFAYNIRRHR